MLHVRPLHSSEDATVLVDVCSKLFAPFFLRQPEERPSVGAKRPERETNTRLTPEVEAFPRCVEPLLFGTWFCRDINSGALREIHKIEPRMRQDLEPALPIVAKARPLSVIVLGQLLQREGVTQYRIPARSRLPCLHITLQSRWTQLFRKCKRECHQVKTSTVAHIYSTPAWPTSSKCNTLIPWLPFRAL